ncbi:CLUMA_CG004354, isoform A [Clunio marinus]|uniref:CLUMA_CG004354, isoform A n=1 Tax=Clunio marinus TaxID=568069 RepID=A0A1J1HRK4_9DIPT|nr:CLUMA_CG004354, isoform A [Clunio marinus]
MENMSVIVIKVSVLAMKHISSNMGSWKTFQHDLVEFSNIILVSLKTLVNNTTRRLREEKDIENKR